MSPKSMTHQIHTRQGESKAVLSSSSHYWCQTLTCFLNIFTELENCLLKLYMTISFPPGSPGTKLRPTFFLSTTTNSSWEEKSSKFYWVRGQGRWPISYFCYVRPAYLRTKMKPETNNNSVQIIPSQTKQLPAIVRWLYWRSYLDL